MTPTGHRAPPASSTVFVRHPMFTVLVTWPEQEARTLPNIGERGLAVRIQRGTSRTPGAARSQLSRTVTSFSTTVARGVVAWICGSGSEPASAIFWRTSMPVVIVPNGV